jgi:hypothetical protein
VLGEIVVDLPAGKVTLPFFDGGRVVTGTLFYVYLIPSVLMSYSDMERFEKVRKYVALL